VYSPGWTGSERLMAFAASVATAIASSPLPARAVIS
jgi:hypothetical protein